MIAFLRSLLLLLLCVTLFATSAAAECAWVQWLLWPEKGHIEYEPQLGFANIRECVEHLNDAERKIRAEPKTPFRTTVGRTAPTELAIATEGEVRWLRCLPDTVDPRGPKGGGR